ncbi:hypothetical protein TrRE_jg12140 [Triparma retinervis]|uniref:Protein kinase domain-containing protein n=1 Tax=Triparma retinervis TaxID=2557542 RepID=A0A9W7CEQ0_9STRA|nr:hypothetical protein TrRE_jg12140 [Triparma retinervis]
MRLAIDHLDSNLNPAFFTFFANKDSSKDQSLSESFNQSLDTVEDFLKSRPFLCSQTMTLADIAYIPFFERMCTALSHFKNFEIDPVRFENVCGWMKRVFDRPSFKTCEMGEEKIIKTYANVSDTNNSSLTISLLPSTSSTSNSCTPLHKYNSKSKKTHYNTLPPNRYLGTIDPATNDPIYYSTLRDWSDLTAEGRGVFDTCYQVNPKIDDGRLAFHTALAAPSLNASDPSASAEDPEGLRAPHFTYRFPQGTKTTDPGVKLGEGFYRSAYVLPVSRYPGVPVGPDGRGAIYKSCNGIESVQKRGGGGWDNKEFNSKSGLSRYDKEVMLMHGLRGVEGVVELIGVKCEFDGGLIQEGSDMMLSDWVALTWGRVGGGVKVGAMKEAARGIEMIWGQDATHTDVNAGQFQVVVRGEGEVPEVRIQDFNRARFPQRTPEGLACPFKIQGAGGKLRSPEEYRRIWLTPSIDIFSFGYVLFEVLLGRKPYSREADFEEVEVVKDGVLRKKTMVKAKQQMSIVNGWTHPIEGWDETSQWQREVVELIKRCWSYDPEDRPTAKEVRERLEDIEVIARSQSQTKATPATPTVAHDDADARREQPGPTIHAVILVRIYPDDKPKWTTTELEQWIRYMQYAGVGHIYLYDNYKVPSERLEPWITQTFRTDEVSYHDWGAYQPYTIQGTQVRAYQHALDQYGLKSTYQIPWDMDEYPFVSLDTERGFLQRTIAKLEMAYPNVGEFSCKNFLYLGPNNHQQHTTPTIARWKRRTPEPANGLDKPIYRTDRISRCQVHHNSLKAGWRSMDVDPSILRMNHYWGARIQNWGDDTPESLAKTIEDPEKAYQMAVNIYRNPPQDFQTRSDVLQLADKPSNYLYHPSVWLHLPNSTTPSNNPSSMPSKVTLGDFHLISRLESGSTNTVYRVSFSPPSSNSASDVSFVLKASDGARIWGRACALAIQALLSPPPPPHIKRSQLPYLHFVGDTVNPLHRPPPLSGLSTSSDDSDVLQWPHWPSSKTLHIEVEEFRDLSTSSHHPAYYGDPNFSMSAVQAFARSLLTLLIHSHSRGVMNKDLHSSNVWWDATAGLASVLDWNGADIYTSSSPPLIHVAEECHGIQPPEANGDEAARHVNTHHFDIWSVGILLGWQMDMPGPVLWYGEGRGWEPPHELGWPGGGEEGDMNLDEPGIRLVKDLVERACERDPKARPTAEDFGGV